VRAIGGELLSVLKFRNEIVELSEDQRAAIPSLFQSCVNGPIAEHSQYRILIRLLVHQLAQLDKEIDDLHFVGDPSIKHVLDLA
jgi:hypothetical protein